MIIMEAEQEANRQIKNSRSLTFRSANARRKSSSYEELYADEMEELEEEK